MSGSYDNMQEAEIIHKETRNGIIIHLERKIGGRHINKYHVFSKEVSGSDMIIERFFDNKDDAEQFFSHIKPQVFACGNPPPIPFSIGIPNQFNLCPNRSKSS